MKKFIFLKSEREKFMYFCVWSIRRSFWLSSCNFAKFAVAFQLGLDINRSPNSKLKLAYVKLRLFNTEIIVVTNISANFV